MAVKPTGSSATEFQSAASQIEHIGGLSRFAASIDIGVKRVDDEFALFLVKDQTGMTKDAEMMRDIGDVDAEQIGESADVLGTGLETLNDLQPFRIGQRLEPFGTFTGLEVVLHGGGIRENRAQAPLRHAALG
jgi:hypothetical protein